MWDWTEEQQMLAKTVEDFTKAEILPKVSDLDESEGWNDAAFRKLGPLGLLGITVKEQFGGANLGAVEATIVMEKLAEGCGAFALSYLAHSMLCVNNLHENGSEEQKRRYLPKLLSGEWISGMAMTEPGSGSDALGMKTTAEKKGNCYLLTGTKTFITNGPTGDCFWVYAKTGPSKKDVSTFIVEKSFKGFSAGKKLKKFGMRSSPTGELIFDKCEVPKENLVGRENDSISHMMKNLNIERITISGISLGLAKASTDYACGYAKERSQFGKNLSEFQMIQEKIANMITQYDAGRALTYASAHEYDKGSKDMTLGAKAKLFTAPMATQIGLEAMQILGGYGYTKEYPVERYVRDAKLMEIGAGTNEVMRLIIARSALDLSGD